MPPPPKKNIPCIFPKCIISKSEMQILEIAILFHVIERYGNYVFDYDNPPKAQRTRDINYVLGAYKVYRKGDGINFGGGITGLVIRSYSTLSNSWW